MRHLSAHNLPEGSALNTANTPLRAHLQKPNGRRVRKVKPSTHDYSRGASKFADAALSEKMKIILPALRDIFAQAGRDGYFNQQEHTILDIGCGPFLVGRGLITEGFKVDGFDTQEAMIEAAQKIMGAGQQTPSYEPTLTTKMDELTVPYNAAMMCFVHQCCQNKGELTELFTSVHDHLIGNNGLFVLVGTHPEYLHVRHAHCAYDVKDSMAMEDGQPYTGTIYGGMGDKAYELRGDYYWSLSTLQDTAREVGLELETRQNISDQASIVTQASKEPAYFAMTFRRRDKNGAPKNTI